MIDIEDILGDVITEGKTKRIHEHKHDSNLVVMEMKDAVTAGDGARKQIIPGKALATWEIASRMMHFINKYNSEVSTAYVESPVPGYIIAMNLDMAPLEFVSRKIATGSLVKKLIPVPDGTILENPTAQVYLKDDSRNDPELSPDVYKVLAEHGKLVDWGITGALPSPAVKDTLMYFTTEIADLFYKFFKDNNLKFYDFKIEFGKTTDGMWLIGDSISPDEMRLRDADGQKLDKDGFRQGASTEEVEKTYNLAVRRYRDLMPNCGKFTCELPEIKV